MNHQDYKEMLEFTALDVLDETESRAIQAHLETCSECRAELEELRDVAAALIYLTEPVAPRPELNARILQSIHAAEVRPPTRADGTQDADKIEGVAGEHSAATSSFVPPHQTQNRKWGTASLLTALAVSVVLVALVVALIVLWNRNNARQRELARLSSHNEEMRREVDRPSQRNQELQAERDQNATNKRGLRTGAEGRANGYNKTQGETLNRREANEPPTNAPPTNGSPVTPATDARVVELTGTDKAPQARASLNYNIGTGVISLSVSELPPPPAGKAYQLWFIVKGRALPGGVFITSPEGRAMMRGQMTDEARNASAFAITLEKSSGENKPKGSKYLLGATS